MSSLYSGAGISGGGSYGFSMSSSTIKDGYKAYQKMISAGVVYIGGAVLLEGAAGAISSGIGPGGRSLTSADAAAVERMTAERAAARGVSMEAEAASAARYSSNAQTPLPVNKPANYTSASTSNMSTGFATGEQNYAYRSLNIADGKSVAAGEGIFAKNPSGNWSLEQHLVHGSSKSSMANDPWIASSYNLDIAKSFSSGNGIVQIDLSQLPQNSFKTGWQMLPRSSPGYHYSVWQQEVSIFGHIPQHAITPVPQITIMPK